MRLRLGKLVFQESFSLFRLAFRHERQNYFLLAAVVILELLSIAGLYFLNTTYGQLYQAIQDYNKQGIWHAIATFSAIAFVLVLINGYVGFYCNKLANGLRVGLTRYYFARRAHLPLAPVANEEQRVQEDFRRFGELAVEFWSAILRSVVKLPLFVGVIITLTSWWVGALIVAATLVGTWLTKIVGKKQILLQSVQETNEANFRESLKDRSLTNNILFYWGIIQEQFVLINQQQKILSFVQSGLGQGFALLPFVVLMPLYIAKTITMGNFFQAVNALSKVLDSLSVLIDNRQLMVNIGTSLARVKILLPTEE